MVDSLASRFAPLCERLRKELGAKTHISLSLLIEARLPDGRAMDVITSFVPEGVVLDALADDVQRRIRDTTNGAS